MKRIVFVLGTRPEIIKLMPVIKECEKRNKHYQILFTNQHFSPNMSLDFFDEFSINKEKIFINDSNNILEFLNQYIYGPNNDFGNPEDLIVVQGDTRSAYYGALVGKMNDCKVFHIEAGLRTGDFNSPYPEEFYRVEISKLATTYFTPTKISYNNLVKEGVDELYVVQCGNTVIQSLILMDKKEQPKNNDIYVTIHRSENKPYMERIFTTILDVAMSNEDYNFKIILHPNNYFRNAININYEELTDNIELIQPMSYNDFLDKLSSSKFIITDSGGIQEECCHLKTFCFVLRDTTERPETMICGYGELLKPNEVVRNVNVINRGIKDYDNIRNNMKKNPYYDEECINKIMRRL